MFPQPRSFTVVSLAVLWLAPAAAWAQSVTQPQSETVKQPAPAPAELKGTQGTATPADITEDIYNLLTSVSSRVDTAITRATDAKNSAEEIRDRVREGVAALTDQLRTAIDGAVADVQRIVENELGGTEYVAFTDGPNSCSALTCEPFRQELLLLLDNFESSANGLFQVAALEQLQLNLGRMQGVIEVLPGRILFPLYRVFKMDNGDLLGSLSDLLTELVADLEPITDIFATDAVEAQICAVLTDNTLIFEVIIIRTTARAIGLKLLAKVFDAVGETAVSGDVGVHGYTHVTYEENFPKKFAAVLEALSDAEFYIANAVRGKLEFCLMRQVEIVALERQAALLDGQSQILNAIRGNADLNTDGTTDLTDYALFLQEFRKGRTQP